jgi:S-adenosylmethionine decarboxylase
MRPSGDPIEALGLHLLIELSDCDPAALDDLERIRVGLVAACRNAGATIVGEIFHRFSPHGVTGVVAIAESHASIHTWPERGYAAVDVFTCSERMRAEAIVDAIGKLLGARRVSVRRARRGPTAPAQAAYFAASEN